MLIKAQPAILHHQRNDSVVDPTTLFTILLIALILRLSLFVGFSGSDDAVYSLRGLMASQGEWPDSSYVGALRLGMTLPIAGIIGIFGANELSVAAYGLLASIGEIALVYLFMTKAFNSRAGAFAAIVLSFIPLHTYISTTLWADAPYAFMLTTAVVSLWFGLQQSSNKLFFISGMACSFAGWIKPEPTVIFGLIIVILTIFFSRNPRNILWLITGIIVTTIPNFLVFQVVYGDSLYYLNAGTRNIEANFVANAAPWGDHSAGYYLQLMFKDGRPFWIAPGLALGGLALILSKKELSRSSKYLATWLILMLIAFSLFFYSLSPLRLVPKQVNYALMFAAPLAGLAGLMLSRTPRIIAFALVAIMAGGGIMLAGIASHQRLLHGASNFTALEFARNHPDAQVFTSNQAYYLNEWSKRANKPYANNVLPIGDALKSENILKQNELNYLTFHPNWPENIDNSRDTVRLLKACLIDEIEISGSGNKTTTSIVSAIAIVRQFLPAVIDRQVSFTDAAIKPVPLSIGLIDTECVKSQRL